MHKIIRIMYSKVKIKATRDIFQTFSQYVAFDPYIKNVSPSRLPR